ncbi:MAG: hypothetical protein H6733_02530 [Alphaproteobacteria bacterium]|nr:hypothetical protein [Alphaproteobacteria bacterium]
MALLAAALTLSAWAGTTPMVAITAHGTGQGGDDGRYQGAGGGLTAGLRATGPLWIELDVDAGWLAAGGARFGIAPQLRVFLLPDRLRFGRFSLFAGGGVDLVTPAGLQALPLVQAGAAVDLRVTPSWAVRLDGTYLNHLDGPGAGRGGLGVVWSPAPKPPPEPEAPDTRIWLPYPVCAWRDRDDAVRYLRALHRVEEDDAQGAEDGSGTHGATPAVPPRLFGVGLPGDVVTVDGVEHLAGADGVVGVPAVDGFTTVEVRGGGRRVVLTDVLVIDGEATWVRVPAPTPQRLLFDAASAVIRPDEAARVVALAADTGVWRWRVAGSHSVEGTTAANETLARRRAEAVRDALVAAGVPAASIDIAPSLPPDPDLTVEAQRAVVLSPVAPDDGGRP